nr:oligosaccharide flippase family protein [Pedobacter glucosidilyticus]
MIVSGIFLVPLYLKYIPIETYGAWLATGNVLIWITVIDPGISMVLQQKIGFAYGENDINQVKEYMFAGIFITAVISVLIFVSGLILASFLNLFLKFPSSIDLPLIKKSFIIALAGSALMVFSYSLTSINQGLQSSIGIGIIYVVTTISSILLSIFLLNHNFGLYSLAIVPLFTGAGLTLGNIGYLIWRLKAEKIEFSFSLKEVRTLLQLVSYSFIGKIGSVIANNMDLIIVARYLGPQTVASLNLTKKGPELSKTFIERPVIAFLPAISHLRGSGDLEKQKLILIRLLLIIIWILGLVGAGFITFNDDFVRLWVGEKVFAGQLISFFICINIIFSSVTNCLGNLCFALGSIKNNSLIAFSQSILTGIILVIGAKFYGLMGVVIAPLISIALMSLWIYPLIFFRILKLEKEKKKCLGIEVVIVFFISFFLSYVFQFLYSNNWVAFIFQTLCFSVVFFSVLYLLSQPFRYEIKNLIKFLLTKFN